MSYEFLDRHSVTLNEQGRASLTWRLSFYRARYQFLVSSARARVTARYTTPAEPAPEASQGGRCDHIAIVPGMPKAIAGDEGTPDHWLHVANPGAAGITFTITGRDMAGAKGGTYRRELPAYRSARVNMRDVEAAFDVSNPAGWWTLTVTGSGPLHVLPMMKHGEARVMLLVERPAVCGTGAATRPAGDVAG